MSDKKTIVICKQDLPSTEAMIETSRHLNKLVEIIKKYPRKEDNVENIKSVLVFLESMIWKIK